MVIKPNMLFILLCSLTLLGRVEREESHTHIPAGEDRGYKCVGGREEGFRKTLEQTHIQRERCLKSSAVISWLWITVPLQTASVVFSSPLVHSQKANYHPNRPPVILHLCIQAEADHINKTFYGRRTAASMKQEISLQRSVKMIYYASSGLYKMCSLHVLHKIILRS